MVQALLPETVPASEAERLVVLDAVLACSAGIRIPMIVPQDIEAQRKNFVFGRIFRRRIKVQTLEVSQLWQYKKPTNFCKVTFGIDTLYGGYAHDQLIRTRMLRICNNRLRDAHGAGCNVDDSTLDIVVITWKGIGSKDSPVRKVAKAMVREFWVVENDQCQAGVSVLYRNRKGKLCSLNGIVNKLSDETLAQWIQNGSARHYVYFIDSPSGYRQGMMPAFRVPAEHENDWKTWMETVLDIATGGMFSIMKEAKAGNPQRIDKAIKDVGRQALGVTPSTFFGILNHLAIFCGDLKSPAVETKWSFFDEIKLDAERLGFEYQYSPDWIVGGDGGALNAKEAVRAFAKYILGYEISDEDAVKFGGQHRINSFIKGHNIVVSRNAILAAIHYLKATGQIKAFIQLQRTREDSIRLERLKNVPYEEGGFKDCIVIFGDLDKVEYFGDLTCVKCSTDFSQPLEMRLMDISHTPHGYIPLSKQGIIQMQLMGDDFVEMYKEITPTAMDRIFAQTAYDEVDEVIDDLGDERTSLDLGEDMYNFTAIQQLCPKALEYDVQIKRVIVQSIVDTLNKRLNRFNLTTEGAYLKLVPDVGRFFGIKLLEADEFYAPSLRPIKDGIEFDAVIIRYPLVDFGAFIKGRAVSRRELERRIRRHPLAYYYQEALYDMLDAITGAMIMISSLTPGTTDKLSGADFDGDGVCCFIATAIKKVYAKMKSYANNFGSSVAVDLKVAFDYDLGATSFLYAWALDSDDREPNPAIGVIAGYNVTVSSMLAMVLSGEKKPADIFHYFLDKVEKDEKTGKLRFTPATPGSRPYHRCFTVNGSNDLGVDVSFAGKETTYVTEFMDEAENCDWSLESCIRFLWDLNAVLSKSMNDIIDAAKNGAVVFVPFLDVLMNRVRSSSVATVDYAEIKLSRTDLKFDRINNGYTAPCCSKKSKDAAKKTGVELLVNDPLGVMKKRIFAMAYMRVKEVLEDNVEQELREVSNVRLDASLDLLASFYQDLMKAEGNDKAVAKKAVISMAYALMHMANVTDPEQILGLVTRASNYTKETKGALPKYNTFYAQFNEIVRHYVSMLCPDAIFSRPVFKFGGGIAYVGQEVTFEDGKSADGFYTSGHVTGTFRLEPNDKFQPVINRRVLDMIPEHKEEGTTAVVKLWKQRFVMADGTIKDLSPKYNADKLVEYIERRRTHQDLVCEIKYYDPEQNAIVERVRMEQDMSRLTPVVTSNYGMLGYLQQPKVYRSAYIDLMLKKKFRIQNVMKMGKAEEGGQVSVCLVLQSI